MDQSVFFPYEQIRPGQKEMVDLVVGCLQDKKSALIHAPTGIGKTAGVLVPCINHALDHGLTLFYLTSRHTQHKIVLETIHKIREKSGRQIITADIIGKKWMCLQGGAATMKSSPRSAKR
jgi:DNA excision repair protein ERCC-2